MNECMNVPMNICIVGGTWRETRECFGHSGMVIGLFACFRFPRCSRRGMVQNRITAATDALVPCGVVRFERNREAGRGLICAFPHWTG